MSHKPTDLSSKIAQAFSHLLPDFMMSSHLRSNTPSGFIVYPTELLEGKPHRAERFYKGEFALETGVAKSGTTSPFDIQPPHEEWQNELLSFTWLRDLRALEEHNAAKAQSSSNVGLSTIHARSLINNWIEGQQKEHLTSPGIKARRLISWFVNAQFLLNHDDGIFQDTFLSSIDQQVKSLNKITPHRVKKEERLCCLTALCFAHICLEGAERSLSRKVDLFAEQISKEILPDGGHITRNPVKVVSILLDLLPILSAYEARSKPAPKELINAVDRMFPMLRFFLLGDNGLAQFNGATDFHTDIIKTLLKTDTQSGKPLSHARYSAYHRIHNGQTVLICDGGNSPPQHFDTECHASALSFEMSHNKHRIVVNCGGAKPENEYWFEAAKATAAHSTLNLDDTSLSHPTSQPLSRFKKTGKSSDDEHVGDRHSQNEKGTLIEAAHNGYVDSFGIIHQRRLFLSTNGNDLRGEDSLVVANNHTNSARNFAIRFHLHPDVIVTKPKKGQQLHLVLPNKAAWSFSCSGAKISEEDSHDKLCYTAL